MEEVKIVHYSPRWEKEHIEFARQYWSKKRRFTPEYIYWKFRGQPEQELQGFILAIHNDKVVGQIGMIPCNISIRGKVIEAQWICDLMVDKAMRGSNVAQLLYNHVESNGRIILGSDPSPAARKSLNKNGYCFVTGPNVFLFPISIGGTLSIKQDFFKVFKFIINPVYYWLGIKRRSSIKAFMNVSSSEEIANHLLVKMNALNQDNFVIHDSEFISWRCGSFGTYYQGIQFYKSQSNRSFIMFYEASSCLYVVDLFYETLKELEEIVYFAAYKARSKKLDYLKLMVNTEKEFKDLKKYFVIRMGTRTEIVMKQDQVSNFESLNYFYYTLMDSDENI